MARLIERLVTEVRVDHGSFDLCDDGGPQCAVPDFGSIDEWLFVGDNEIAVISPLAYHVAAVTLEAWDAEPAIAAGWTDSRLGQLRLDSGLVEVNVLVEGEEADAIEVGQAGMYGVRAYVAGRDALAALGPDPQVEPVGVERYLFQFWPAAATS